MMDCLTSPPASHLGPGQAHSDMSTAHRPTWKPSTGGGGLRDGSTAPPTLQHSAKDQTAHTRLKYRSGKGKEKEEEEEDAKDDYEAFFALPESHQSPPLLDHVKDDDGHEHLADAREADSSTSPDSDHNASQSDSEEDEEALLRELEKIRQERAAAALQAKQNSNPLLAPAPLLKRRWEEEGVVFRKQATRTTEDQKRRFINDTTRSDHHRSFMDRYIQ